jgi:hypothetical protein
MSDQPSVLDGAVSSPTNSWAIVKKSNFENLAKAESETTPQLGFLGSGTEHSPTASASPMAGSVTPSKFGYTLGELVSRYRRR